VFSFLRRSKQSSQSEQVQLPSRSITSAIRSLFPQKFDLAELEETLLRADFGIAAAEEITQDLAKQLREVGELSEQQTRVLLRDLLATKLTREDSSLNLQSGSFPYVFLVVGVNGAGKTTTIGKLAKWLSDGDWKVIIGAADTFRAAAVDQLATWAERAGVEIVRPQTQGQDPAAVAYQTVERAISEQADIAIIDTAGRLQNKQDLMDELSKITRAIQKQTPVSEVLLVLDATMGQNALAQAKAFTEAANVTGVVLTKLDGTAKGGIAFAVQQKLGIPIKLVGVGEGVDDFAFFSPKDFASGLVAS
jgi:fused signal recognition particle receptor